jgi:hypothetical protein
MRTGTSLLKIAMAVAVCATVSSAMAQRQGGGAGRGAGQVNPIALAKAAEVQKDLELSTEQKDSIGKLEVEQVNFQDFQGDREGMVKKQTEIREAAQKKVDAILLPPQVERFAQIQLQLDGARALTTPKVAEKLKLTDEQKTKLAAVFPAAGGGRGQGGGGGGGGATREERDASALEILTADQKTQFTAMQGKKIEIDRAALGGGFGGRGQGGPGGQGGGRRGKKGPDA